MTNCKNCGAILTGCECEYCGTWYEAGEVFEKYDRIAIFHGNEVVSEDIREIPLDNTWVSTYGKQESKR